ncbi:MAG: class I SAM-dependent methyltransferase [Jatrophihabitantaceae bacterium]
MKTEAYEQYRSEANNWLKAARLRLLDAVLTKHAGTAGQLRILEIGAGVGQNVEVLRRFGTVDVLEIDPLGLRALREVEGINQIYDQPIPTELSGSYDVIIAFDVLEHLPDDRVATKWVASHLNPGGHFIATVPAYQWMFSDHDVALKHYRRYTRQRLVAALPPELPVRQAGYFVCLLFPLAAALRLVGKAVKLVRRSPADRTEAVRKQSSAVPALLDRLFLLELSAEVKLIGRGRALPFGLSVFCVARKS